MKRTTSQIYLTIRRAALLCGVAILIFAASTGAATATEETVPGQETVTAAVGASAEGKQMLITALVLAGALIGMERVCSWRLGANQRRAAADQGLAAVLPPIPSTSSPLSSWSFPMRLPGER